jgi:hypothetical protein
LSSGDERPGPDGNVMSLDSGIDVSRMTMTLISDGRPRKHQWGLVELDNHDIRFIHVIYVVIKFSTSSHDFGSKIIYLM